MRWSRRRRQRRRPRRAFGRSARLPRVALVRRVAPARACSSAPASSGGRASSIDRRMPYYVTTPIYYVNARAPSRPRVHDHRRRRPRPPHAPARRGRLLPHGHRRARRAGGAGGRARWASRRASWPTATRERFRDLAQHDQRHQRLLHPHERPGARGGGPGGRSSAIHDNGHVYAGTYEGYYCPRCADFKTDAELVDGNKCPIHLIELEREKEDNWFFRLSAFQEPLERLYAERPELGRCPRSATTRRSRSSSRACSDVSLSRARLQLGRARAVGRVAGHLRLDRRAPQLLHGAHATRARARTSPSASGRPTVHLIGKDILKFHAVIWPAMLMAAGIEAAEAASTSTATC